MSRPVDLAAVPARAIQAELDARARRLRRLLRRRARLLDQLARLQAAAPADLGPGGRRPAGYSLPEVLEGVLRGGPMSVAGAAASARAAGYETSARDGQYYYKMVARALAESGRFRRVSRGVYALR